MRRSMEKRRIDKKGGWRQRKRKKERRGSEGNNLAPIRAANPLRLAMII